MYEMSYFYLFTSNWGKAHWYLTFGVSSWNTDKVCGHFPHVPPLPVKAVRVEIVNLV